MRIVVDIPESILNTIQADEMISREQLAVLQMHILNGTPLPEGHGRLIDADALKMDKRVCGDRYLSKTSLFVANKVIEQAPTIIEANKAESEDKGVLEKLAERQNNLSATNKAWSDAIEKNGYVN